MAKIIEISSEKISIGMDNGTVKEVSSESLNFVPHIGDLVEVFETGSKTIVSKVETKETPAAQPNIIINNTNTNSNVNTNTNINGGFGGRPKNKWVAIVLCLCLGVLGAHKFYEGKIGMGILYLCTAGLCLVGVVIDFLALLAKPNPYYV